MCPEPSPRALAKSLIPGSVAAVEHRYLFRFGRFEVDPSEGWFRRISGEAADTGPGDGDEGQNPRGLRGVPGEIPLQPMVFEALLHFLEHPGVLISKDALLSHLWPDVEVEEGSLSQVIHKLRRALGDDADARRMLQTVPRRGFRFVAVVEKVARVKGPTLRGPTPEPGQVVVVEAAPEIAVTATPLVAEVAVAMSTAGGDVALAQVGARVSAGQPVTGVDAEVTPVVRDDALLPGDAVQPLHQDSPRKRPYGRRYATLAGVVVVLGGVAAVGTFAALSGAAENAPTEQIGAGSDADTATHITPGAGPAASFPLLTGGPHPIRRLTRFPERVQDASLAPDGTWFAFASTRGGTGPYSIWAQRLDGGDAIRLTRPDGEDTTPRVFPDGRRVAFTRCSSTNPHAPGCGVWQAAAFGGDERMLVPGCNLGDVLPEGNAVVCMRAAPAGGIDLLEVELESRNETRLLHWDGPMDSVAVAPDGTRVAFLAGGTPWVFRKGDMAPVRVLEDGPEAITLAFGPDNRHLLCDLSLSGRRNIWALPIDGGPRVALTAGAGTAVYPWAARDGRSLLFTQEHREYLMFRVEGGASTPVRIDSPTYWMSFSVDASGRFLAYWDGDGVGDNEVGVLDVHQGTMRGFGRGQVPAISADGRWLARVLDGDLWLTDIVTLAQKRIVTGGVRGVRPAFSADGRQLAWVGSSPARGLHRIDIESGAIATVARGRFAAPSFSPDGRMVAAGGDFGTPESSGLHLLPADGGEGGRVFVPELRSYEAAPIWDDDGRGVRVLTRERSFGPRLVHVGLDGVSDDDGKILPLTPEPANWGVFDVQITSGGHMFYLLQRVHGDIYRVELGR